MVGSGARVGHWCFPESVSALLWDVRPDDLREEHSRFIIERILEWGDVAACNWMFRTFPRTAIVATAKESRRLGRKSANYWAWYFGLDPLSVRGLGQEVWWRIGSRTGAESTTEGGLIQPTVPHAGGGVRRQGRQGWVLVHGLAPHLHRVRPQRCHPTLWPVAGPGRRRPIHRSDRLCKR